MTKVHLDITVSIVVPVYNGERYIKDTIDSLLAQTLESIEIIVVDDGSTDNTRNLLDAYNDPRLRVITQQNSGTFAARIRGFQESRGSYIGYVDSDDLAKPTMFKKLYEATQSEKIDIVSCGIVTIQGAIHGKSWHATPPASLEGEDPCIALLEETLWGYCWNKLYRKELLTPFVQDFIGTIQDPLVMAEDFLQNLLLFSQASSFVHIKDPLYVYRIHSGSIMRRVDRGTLQKRIQNILLIDTLVTSYVDLLCNQSHDNRLKEALQVRRWSFAQSALNCVHLMAPIGRWTHPLYDEIYNHFGADFSESFTGLRKNSGCLYRLKWSVKRNFPWVIPLLQRFKAR